MRLSIRKKHEKPLIYGIFSTYQQLPFSSKNRRKYGILLSEKKFGDSGMKPFFTDAQLNSMSRESMIEIMKIMQAQVEKKETEVQLLKDKQKELEFMNAMLSDQCHLVKTLSRCIPIRQR